MIGQRKTRAERRAALDLEGRSAAHDLGERGLAQRKDRLNGRRSDSRLKRKGTTHGLRTPRLGQRCGLRLTFTFKLLSPLSGIFFTGLSS